MLAITANGSAAVLAAMRPGAFAVDPAGRIALLDPRDDAVVLLAPDGSTLGRYDTRAAGVERAGAVALGRDGALVLFDRATSGAVVVR